MSIEQCTECENAIHNLPKTVKLEGLTPTQLINVQFGLCMDCPHLQSIQDIDLKGDREGD